MKPAGPAVASRAGPDRRPWRRSLFGSCGLPGELVEPISTSTLLAAWNAAVYVAQIDDRQLAEAMTHGHYPDATRDVLTRHGGLWFNNESFVVQRQAS